jgi:hypothetical protein
LANVATAPDALVICCKEIDLFVSVWVAVKATNVSVIAGSVKVNADAADAGVKLTLPVAVEEAILRMPVVVPATPIVNVGVEKLKLTLTLGAVPAPPPKITSPAVIMALDANADVLEK